MGDFVSTLKDAVLLLVQEYQSLALPAVFVLALGESLAFLSLLLPSTVLILAIAGLLTAVDATWHDIGMLWGVATFGGIVGYTISYWVGLWFKDDVGGLWPFSRNPEWIPRGQSFFARWGTWGVFFGHMFGPVRAVIPVVAGMFAMKQLKFQIANVPSAAIWATSVLTPLWVPKLFGG